MSEDPFSTRSDNPATPGLTQPLGEQPALSRLLHDLPPAARPPIVAWLARLDLDFRSQLVPRNAREWCAALDTLFSLPATGKPPELSLRRSAVRMGRAGHWRPADLELARAALLRLHPWRKGPFRLFGVDIDAEWRSDLKWARLESAADRIGFRDQKILDVGCGNGYTMFRLLAHQPRWVVGIEPMTLYVLQFQAMRLWRPDLTLSILPARLEDVPPCFAPFDIILSMGVLYHQRDPLKHLANLRARLPRGGRLILETLIVEHPGVGLYDPAGRYAKMRNVGKLPSIDTLKGWVQACSFESPHMVDISSTTTREQRRTPWMHFESLADFLNAEEPAKTVEGHPAPRRAMLIARAR